jgi:hypothetical protein
MAKRQKFDKDDFLAQYGLSFNFSSETYDEAIKEGQDFRGEYGFYKYTLTLEEPNPKKDGFGSSAHVFLISDQIDPIGVAYEMTLDGKHGIYRFHFGLDAILEKKGKKEVIRLNFGGNSKHCRSDIKETRDATKIPELMQAAIQEVIALTEQELKSILTKPTNL